MSKRDKTPARQDASDTTVKLKPVFGIRPGTYLTVIYGIVLALLVFFILFYPGLRNRGAYLSIDVQPGKASIMVDGTFAGTAPGTVFVKQGKRRIEVFKSFYSPASAEVDIRGRIFATLFVRDKRKISFDLEVSDLSGLIENSFQDFTQNPFIPQIVSDAAWAAYGTRKSAQANEAELKLFSLIEKSMLYVNPTIDASATTTTAENQLAEVLRASLRTATSGTFLTPQNFIAFVQKSIQLKEKYENSPSWLLLALSREHSKKLAASQWISGHFDVGYRGAISKYYPENLGSVGGGGGSVSVIGGIVFRSVPSGVLIMGKDDDLESLGKLIDLFLPHPVAIEPFLLSETELTNKQFLAFVEDNTQWRPSQRNTLTAQGMATDAYLSDWVNDRPPAGREGYPVSFVSYVAARAYCDWLTKTLQASRPGTVIRLPTEAEWEWSARGGLKGMPYPLGEKPGKAVFFQQGISSPSRAGSSEPNGYGLKDMMGNLWEWCADSFGPSDYLLSSLDPGRNAGFLATHPISKDKVVRGGGWSDQKELIKVYTRGSQPEDWCTPFLGFRVVVSRK